MAPKFLTVCRTCAVLAILFGLGGRVAAQAADKLSKKQTRPFSVEREDEDLKTFILPGPKPIDETQLLPPTPKALPRAMSTADLAQVPEVGLEDPLAKTGSRQEAMEDMEFRFAKVNHFNLKKTDGFLHALLAQRPDLAGLPFKMGTDCRLPQDRAQALGTGIGIVRGEREGRAHDDRLETEEALHQPVAAALMQIHGPKEKQVELAMRLSAIPHVEATRGLARLALFSPDERARAAAARALKVRRDQDYTSILLDGLRYPLPVTARRAAEALVRLERKDLAPQLVAALDAPDPRLPTQGKAGWQARELVRINHHRNCLLCHAPAHTKAVVLIPDGDKKHGLEKIQIARKALEKLKDDSENLLAPAPLPNRSFDSKSGGYGRDGEQDHILVRVDITYLRQDFSAFLPVENAAPWPDYQRFDFLVRTRTLSEAEATALRTALQPKQGGAVSPYQQAALYGLRELTGLEATTPAEWRRLLKLP